QTLVAVATGTLDPASLDPQPTHPLFTLNHYRMYDAWLALHREGRSFLRLQMNFLHNQGFIPELGDLDHQLPELRERLKNQFFFFGDDMLRTGAIGEWAAPFATPSNANGYAVWYESQRLVAKAGWRNENAQAGSPTSSAAIHEDGVHIAPHNPWFAMHYATTGLNVLGQQINPGQQISRQQALHAYTRANAWYLNRENDLGSIEEGKLADLLVLDRDYF